MGSRFDPPYPERKQSKKKKGLKYYCTVHPWPSVRCESLIVCDLTYVPLDAVLVLTGFGLLRSQPQFHTSFTTHCLGNKTI